jgi:hypothetical protein
MSDMILLADGFEDAFIGIGTQFNRHFAIYDREACIKVLMDRDGMSKEDAEDFFNFNVVSALVGHGAPAFVRRMVIEDASDVIDEMQELDGKEQ